MIVSFFKNFAKAAKIKQTKMIETSVHLKKKIRVYYFNQV